MSIIWFGSILRVIFKEPKSYAKTESNKLATDRPII